MEAFRTFNFDGNAAWKSYLQSVEIPSNDASKIVKLKAKWYKKNVDADFDIAAATDSAGPAADSGARSWNASESATTGGARTTPPPPSSGGARTPRATAPAGGGASQTPLLVLYALMTVLAVPAVVASLLPLALLVRCWRWFLQLSLLTQGYALYQAHGLPKLNLTSLKTWAASTLPTTGFQYMSIALCFMPQPPMALVVVPLASVAAYHAAVLAHARFGHTAWWRARVARAYRFLEVNQASALEMNAGAEIGVGFSLIVQLLSPARNFLLLVFFWQILRMRYFQPDSRAYHQKVWRKVDARTSPYLARVPPLATLVGYAQRWFTSLPQR